MSDKKIFEKLLNYLSNLDLKNFEIEINNLFQIKENQKNPNLLNLYGLFFEAKKDTNKAINIFANCIKLNPDYAPPYFNLGRIYFINNMFKYAISFLEKHIAKDQTVFDSYDFLAKSYYQNYQYDNSIKILKEVLEKFKDKIDINQKAYIYNFLGANHNLNKQPDISMIYYEKALSLNSENVNTIGNIGNALRALGKTDEAKEYFNKALLLEPNNANIHKDLSVINKYKDPDDEHLRSMISVYNQKGISESDKETLGFAIAKAYDDFKDAKNASLFLNDCNESRRKHFNYEINKDIAELEFHKKIFAKSNYEKRYKENEENIIPIFILGMPRSGSTLIEQIISSHSEVSAGDELSYLADAITTEIPHNSLDEFESKFKENKKEYLEKIKNNYLSRLKGLAGNNKFVTDKMPLNFKLIGLIKYCMPKAKIIHCVRDGKDTCLSIYKNNFATQAMPWAYDQKELASFFNVYTEYMHFWKNNYDEFVFDQSYEALLNDTEDQIKRLLKFCDLGFEENCLKFYENKRAVNTASTMQVRQPIYKSSVKLWKHYEPYLTDLFKNIKNYNLN